MGQQGLKTVDGIKQRIHLDADKQNPYSVSTVLNRSVERYSGNNENGMMFNGNDSGFLEGGEYKTACFHTGDNRKELAPVYSPNISRTSAYAVPNNISTDNKMSRDYRLSSPAKDVSCSATDECLEYNSVFTDHTLPHAKLKLCENRTASINRRSGRKQSKIKPKPLWKEVLPPILPSDQEKLNAVMLKNYYLNNAENDNQDNRHMATQTDNNNEKGKLCTVCKRGNIKIENKTKNKSSILCCIASGEVREKDVVLHSNFVDGSLREQLEFGLSKATVTKNSSVSERHLKEKNKSSAQYIPCTKLDARIQEKQPTFSELEQVSEREKALDEWVPSSCLMMHRLAYASAGELDFCDDDIKPAECSEEKSQSFADSAQFRKDFTVSRNTLSESFDGSFVSKKLNLNVNELNTNNNAGMRFLSYGSDTDDNEDYASKYKRLLLEQDSIHFKKHEKRDHYHELNSPATKYNASLISSEDKRNQIEARVAKKIRLSTCELQENNEDKKVFENPRTDDSNRNEEAFRTESTEEICEQSNQRQNCAALERQQTIEDVSKVGIQKMIQHFEEQMKKKYKQENESLNKTSTPVKSSNGRRFVKNTRRSLHGTRDNNKADSHGSKLLHMSRNRLYSSNESLRHTSRTPDLTELKDDFKFELYSLSKFDDERVSKFSQLQNSGLRKTTEMNNGTSQLEVSRNNISHRRKIPLGSSNLNWKSLNPGIAGTEARLRDGEDFYQPSQFEDEERIEFRQGRSEFFNRNCCDDSEHGWHNRSSWKFIRHYEDSRSSLENIPSRLPNSSGENMLDESKDKLFDDYEKNWQNNRREIIESQDFEQHDRKIEDSKFVGFDETDVILGENRQVTKL